MHWQLTSKKLAPLLSRKFLLLMTPALSAALSLAGCSRPRDRPRHLLSPVPNKTAPHCLKIVGFTAFPWELSSFLFLLFPQLSSPIANFIEKMLHLWATLHKIAAR
uniref:Putative secreted protein n=1 Tax=Ixodes ricinus TaxID=34613 RepID=A0A6B0U904_IXORI